MPETPTLRAVIFRVGDLVCAAPAEVVREVLPPLPVTRIPGVAEAVEGLVNVRGVLLTVVDGHILVGRPRAHPQPGAAADDDAGEAILLLDLDGRRVGLVVSEVLDFVEMPAEALEERQDLAGLDSRLVRAMGNWHDRPFALLDLAALVAPTLGQ